MSTETTVGLDAGNGVDKPAETKATKGTVTSDPQLVACIKIARILDALTPTERSFAIEYIENKYTDGTRS